MVVVENHLITPSPTVFAVVIVDLGETIEHLLDIVDITRLDVRDQTLFLALGQEKSAEINPTSLTCSIHGFADVALFLGTLQHGSHIDTQGDIIILQTLT